MIAMTSVRNAWRVLIVLLLLAPPVAAEGFDTWLATLRAEALERGIRATTLDAALHGARPIERVIELDRNQPEFELTFHEYLERVAPPDRVDRGHRLLAEKADLLALIQERYGVQPHVLVALWAIESDYGRLQGSFDVVPALVTLAHDGRRGDFFRGELMAALHILDEGHTTPDRMRGSWAGAMGQFQFMPSTFRLHAVDFDADGRRDIWDTEGDALASAANYLAKSGWRGEIRWGRAVRLPAGFDASLTGPDTRKPISAWQSLGVRRHDGSDLPRQPDLQAAVIVPRGSPGSAYLVYANFDVLMEWNRSTSFALAVGILSDRIAWR